MAFNLEKLMVWAKNSREHPWSVNEEDEDYYESLEEYLSNIRPYLENMIREYISVGEWKLQLTISIKFISSQNAEQFHIRYS